MFAYPPMNYVATVTARFEIAAVFDVGVIRHSKIGRSANQHRQARRDRIDYLAAGHAGRNLFGVFKTWQVLLPIFLQFAGHPRAPQLAERLIVLFILTD